MGFSKHIEVVTRNLMDLQPSGCQFLPTLEIAGFFRGFEDDQLAPVSFRYVVPSSLLIDIEDVAAAQGNGQGVAKAYIDLTGRVLENVHDVSRRLFEFSRYPHQEVRQFFLRSERCKVTEMPINDATPCQVQRPCIA